MRFWLDKEESRRLRQMVHVLFDNHLGHYILRLKLRRKLPFDKRMQKHMFLGTDLSPEKVVNILEYLGGGFVKLGQLLSLRPDLIPTEYCAELTKLQDKVSPFPVKDAKRIIEEELGKPVNKIFSKFDDEPIAAASMGQVHRAVLKDGTKVAVKVQRPGIEDIMRVDIKLLYRLAKVIKRKYGVKFFDPVEIISEFERYTENELNYLKEGHNIDTFHKNFSKSWSVVVPKVFWEFTTRRVLTMEYLPGKRLSSVSGMTKEKRKEIFNTIINSEFEQVFVMGFFHADPHPGNFLAMPDGKIALLDFGIVGRVDDEFKDRLTDFFIALVEADVKKIVNEAIKLGITTEDTDIKKIKDVIYDKMASYYNRPLTNFKMSEVMNDLISVFRENNLKMQPDFVLLTKAVVTLESVATRFDPNFNFIEVAKPFVRHILRQRLHPKEIARRAREKLDVLVEFAEAIPAKTNLFLKDLHDTDTDLRSIDKNMSVLAVELDRSSNRIAFGFLAGALFIASTILLHYEAVQMFGMSAFSFFGYVLALIMTLSVFVSVFGEKKI